MVSVFAFPLRHSHADARPGSPAAPLGMSVFQVPLRTCSTSVRGRKKRERGRFAALPILARQQGGIRPAGGYRSSQSAPSHDQTLNKVLKRLLCAFGKGAVAADALVVKV